MRGDSIDASRPESRVDLWMENENIFDRSERSLSLRRSSPPPFTGGRGRAERRDLLQSGGAADDAMPSPPSPPPGPIRGDHQFRCKEWEEDRIRTDEATDAGGRCDGGRLFVCLTTVRGGDSKRW